MYMTVQAGSEDGLAKSYARPRTVHDASDAELSAVRRDTTSTRVTSGMSICIHAPTISPASVTFEVTAATPSTAKPAANSSPDTHAESWSPSNAKYAGVPSPKLDEVMVYVPLPLPMGAL